MSKYFNHWIAEHFYGLSAQTLCQLLRIEYNASWGKLLDEPAITIIINNYIYCDLWAVCTNSATPKQYEIYNAIKYIVEHCGYIKY